MMTNPSGAFGGAVKPPPMTDNEIRLECVKLAVQLGVRPETVTTVADAMFRYVTNGNPVSATVVGING